MGPGLAQGDGGPHAWLEAGGADWDYVGVRAGGFAFSCLGEGGKSFDGPLSLLVPTQVEAVIHVFFDLFPDVREARSDLDCNASGYSHDHQGEHCRDQRVLDHVLRPVLVVEGSNVLFEPPQQLEHLAPFRLDRTILMNYHIYCFPLLRKYLPGKFRGFRLRITLVKYESLAAILLSS